MDSLCLCDTAGTSSFFFFFKAAAFYFYYPMFLPLCVITSVSFLFYFVVFPTLHTLLFVFLFLLSALFSFWFHLQCCIEHSVAFSSLCYTAVWGQSSGWCEISHSSDSRHTSLKSQQTCAETGAITSGHFAAKYCLKKLFQICKLLLLQI